MFPGQSSLILVQGLVEVEENIRIANGQGPSEPRQPSDRKYGLFGRLVRGVDNRVYAARERARQHAQEIEAQADQVCSDAVSR